MRNEGRIAGPIALTIAGFDPSSGAGITADLAVFAAHGIFGISAITAMTVQSTMGVRRSQLVPPELLAETLTCLQDDLPPDGIKIGMLGGAEQVRAVADYLRLVRNGSTKPLVVLDPVLRSSSSATLLSESGLLLLQNELLSLVDVITPNVAELALFTGMPCATPMETALAALAFTADHPGLTAIVTGGDRVEPDDLLVQESMVTVLHGERIETTSTHGTGCAFSSALLCELLQEDDILTAAWSAKRYVQGALRTAVQRGSGHGPMNLLWPILQREDG